MNNTYVFKDAYFTIMQQCKFLLFVLLLLLSEFSFAQECPAPADSAKFYRNIETFSKKRKLTRYIYSLFLRPVPCLIAVEKKTEKKQVFTSDRDFEGKIIRAISITTLDPFEYSSGDTAALPLNLLFSTANQIHVKSQQITIRNLLLIHKNKPFDSLLVKESERLIRTQPYVHAVFVTILPVGEECDSIDILIRVWDTWSIVVNGEANPSSFSASLEEKNFLGLGHDFQNTFTSDYTTGKNAFSTNYIIPNIHNTYISTTLHYSGDSQDNFNKYLSIDRPFFSSFAKWAAGGYIGQQYQTNLITKVGDSLSSPYNIKLNTQDYWAGYAHRLFQGNTENARTTNLIVEGRYTNISYGNRLPVSIDTLHLYVNSDFYLARIGISTRKYVKDRFIYKYGVPEDVPVGLVYSLTGGYRIMNNSGQVYTGAQASWGNYNPWGYLSSDFEYGTFLTSTNSVQGVLLSGFNYFTTLVETGGVRWRQFVKPQFTLGINRLTGESININNGNGIQSFNSPYLIGTQKVLLTFQTQFYLPWRLLGFDFGPYLIYSLGILGTQASGFTQSKGYSQIGIGLLINNEYLVFNTFQVSIAWYPNIPGTGNNVFKINPDKSGSLGLQDFNIGKPAIVTYQ